MKSVRPKPLGAPANLNLSPEEDFVLSRIDGRLSVSDLVVLTGMAEPRVNQIVSKLAENGAVELEAMDASSGYLPDVGSDPSLASNAAAPPIMSRAALTSQKRRAAQAAAIQADEGTASLADFAAALGMDPSTMTAARLPQRAAVEAPVPAERVGSDPPPPMPVVPSEPPQATSLADFAAALGMDPKQFAEESADDAELEAPISEARAESRSNYPPPATSDPPEAIPLPELEEVHDELEEVHDELEEVHDELEEVHDELEEVHDDETAAAAAEESEEPAQLKEQDYRKLYEAQFHPLAVDVRAGLAKTAHGTELMALCLDADPRVIASILENATCGLQHVRLIAFHHRTGTGLEMVTRRQDFLRDLLVERRLLRNPQSGDTVLSRIMSSKRLLQTYRIAIDRDVPELTRTKSRGYLRKKYQSAPSEERADLVQRTEGRCLIYMTGCAFDAKMTGILCGKPYNSILFIQNLAKFPATPPALLAHLMKQPFVRKHAPLKKMLLQHPNMPGEVKRKV
jgi:hypothetical protein